MRMLMLVNKIHSLVLKLSFSLYIHIFLNPLSSNIHQPTNISFQVLTMFEMGGEGWGTKLTVTMAYATFIWTVVSKLFPFISLNDFISTYRSKFVGTVYPYISIKFPEHTGERLKRSEAYAAIEDYLATICTTKAKRFKAEIGKENSKLDLSMDDHEEIMDSYKGIKLWWHSNSISPKGYQLTFRPKSEEKRYYQLTFHRRHREIMQNEYLTHVIEAGKEARVKKRQRKLFTNSPATGYYEWKNRMWIHVPLEHPATFDTVAMDPEKKQDIIDDLLTFSRSKDYYARIGKAWKRGYLLYGPPGTGKSSMVAAMANLLDYDIYDLELTAVKNNTMLRKLLIDTTNKSIIVIEDIDCSLDLTGKRKKKKKEGGDDDKEKEIGIPKEEGNEDSKVTLSGLLNFIDGLWSAAGGERLIVFTTNHLDKLDKALIRRGRMDKHIELSYCGFEAFKVLAYNYLGIRKHPLFVKVEELLAEVKITPADVAEHLIPKRRQGAEEEATACLEILIEALVESKSKPVVVTEVEEEEETEVGEEDKKKKEDK